MGDFDQAARFATQAEPEAVIARLLRGTGEELHFAREFDTRTVPLPGGPERTSDLAVVLEGPAHVAEPVLLVFEFQAQHDPEKLDTTLLEAAQYRVSARHGPGREGKFKVVTALIYLQGRCPVSTLRMTLGGGSGTTHVCLVWDVAADSAEAALGAVEAKHLTWGNLFWVPLMSGGGDATVIARWKDLVESQVADPGSRGWLRNLALAFAELAGCLPMWEGALEGWQMTESQVVNRWREQGRLAGRIATKQEDLLAVLERRFPGAITAEVRATIQQNDSLELLHDWLLAAAVAKSLEDFVTALRQ